MSFPQDNATDLMDLAQKVYAKNPKKLKELRLFYRSFCAVLNQEIEAQIKCLYRVQ